MNHRLLSFTTAIVLVAFLSGCASTRQSRKVKISGFLGDYSQLVEGPAGGAHLRYTNPEFDLTRYPKLMLDPISVFTSKGSKLSKVKPSEMKPVVDYLDARVRHALASHFELVERSGPGTLRMRIAITDARKSKPVSDVMSTVLPYGVAMNAASRMMFGKNKGVGEARLEMELLDSQTQERMAAAVDARSGTKNPTGIFNGWNDVKKAYDHWADLMAEGFGKARKGVAK